MQCFAASRINDFSQCLDVIAHEFTHCVTASLMTYNSYTTDYGAINEAMSDIQGKKSIYGILSLICFPAAYVLYFYYDLKKKSK